MGKGRHLAHGGGKSDASKASSETERLPISISEPADDPREGTTPPEDGSERETTAFTSGQKSTNDYIPPPDGGWGWMVVFSSFLIHVIADGIVYSFGVFLIEFVEYFKAGRGAASWVGSLQPAVTYTVGPLSSALTNRYGCRFVTVVGAIIAGVGFVLSMFAPNLYFLYVTAGIMAGIGFGLIYLPAIVCVAQYFEKRRSFATGLAVCGSGFGTFILAPVTEQLVHMYSWRGACLILGGLIFNVIVCGLLFRPLEETVGSEASASESEEGDVTSSTAAKNPSDEDQVLLLSSEKKKKNKTVMAGTTLDDEDNGEEKRAKETVDINSALLCAEEGGRLRGEGEGEGEAGGDTHEMVSLSNGKLTASNANRNHHKPKDGTASEETATETDTITETNTDHLISSLTFEVTSPTESPPTTDDPLSSDIPNGHQLVSASQYLVTPGRNKNGHDLAQVAASDGALNRLHPTSAIHPHQSSGKHHHGAGGLRLRRRVDSQGSTPPNTPRPLARKDIFYSGSLLNIPMYKSHPDVYIATVTPITPDPSAHPRQDGTEDETDKASGPCGACSDLLTEMRSTLKEMLSFSLLKNPVFLMFGISNFLTSIGFNMPFIFLPDRAILAGIDDNRAAFLLSVIGIANTLGRVVFGFLSDRANVNRLMLYSTALTICGTATAISPALGDDYGMFVLYAVIFGVFIGVYVSLTSVVLVDLLGLEYLTNSFGLLLLFQGAATFVGPPIAGWMYDWTGSYDISFILMGSLIALSGSMLYFLPCVERRHNRKCPKDVIVRDMELGKHSVVNSTEDCATEERNV